MSSQYFRSISGQSEVFIHTDEMIPMQTPNGIVFKPRPRGRTVVPPEGVIVSDEVAKLLRSHPGYGKTIIDNDDLEKKLAPVIEPVRPKVMGAVTGQLSAAPKAEKKTETAMEEKEEADVREIKSVRTLSEGIKYCVQRLGASPEQLKGGAESIKAFAAQHGVAFPNL